MRDKKMHLSLVSRFGQMKPMAVVPRVVSAAMLLLWLLFHVASYHWILGQHAIVQCPFVQTISHGDNSPPPPSSILFSLSPFPTSHSPVFPLTCLSSPFLPLFSLPLTLFPRASPSLPSFLPYSSILCPSPSPSRWSSCLPFLCPFATSLAFARSSCSVSVSFSSFPPHHIPFLFLHLFLLFYLFPFSNLLLPLPSLPPFIPSPAFPPTFPPFRISVPNPVKEMNHPFLHFLRAASPSLFPIPLFLSGRCGCLARFLLNPIYFYTSLLFQYRYVL